MSHISKVGVGLKPAFLMVVFQVAYAGVSILYKMVANDGMSLSVLMAYRFLFASAFIVPLACFVERKSKPKITTGVLFQAFLSGVFGACLQQNLFVEAVALATATYATVMYNLIPGATFILAVCFGLERLNIRKSTGKAKMLGTVMGIGGAMILTFYTTTEIHIWSTHVNLMPHLQPRHVAADATDQIWGSALAFGTCLSYSLWLIIQARMSEKFPWHYTSAALMSVMASIQSVIFALCMERDWSQWKLGWNIRLLTAAYTGSVLIVLGLYIVLWGKGKELKRIAQLKLTKGSLKVETLEIITTNHANGKTVKNDTSDIKSGVSTLSGFSMENDNNLSKEGKEENERKESQIDHQGIKA